MRLRPRSVFTGAGRWLRGGIDELFPDMRGAALSASTASNDPEAPTGTPWTPDDISVYCPRCGASAGPGSVTARGCAFCMKQTVRWDRITRLGAYTAPLDERIRLMKFHGQWAWAAWFGDRLAEQVEGPMSSGRLLVCPVPMHWVRCWGRGYNQAALIAEHLARLRDWPMTQLLMRTHSTPPQTSVAPSQRGDNVRNAFALVDPRLDLTGYEVLLIDDVKTSGATLGTCAALLRNAGARSVRCAVAAVGDPRGTDFRTI